MKIFTERAFRERLFEERERTEKEQWLDRNLMEIQKELFDLKCRIEQLERKERKNCKLELFDDDGNYIKPQMEEGKF